MEESLPACSCVELLNQPNPWSLPSMVPPAPARSTVARLLASRLEIPYLDTGAMYRAVGTAGDPGRTPDPLDEAEQMQVAALASDHVIELEDKDGSVRVMVDGQDVSEAIRTPECALMASAVSAVSGVRRALVPMQRRSDWKTAV